MNYDMTFCTGLEGHKLCGECGRQLDYRDRPKDRPLAWFMTPPIQWTKAKPTCEHYLPSEPLSKNTREGE